MSASGAFDQRAGIGDFNNLPNAQVEVGERQDVSMRVAAKWEPTDRFSLLLVADNNDSDNGLGPYTTLIDELPNGAVFGAGYRNSDLARNKYDNNTGQLDQTEVTNKAYGVSVTVEYEVNDSVSAKVILSDRHSEYRAGLDDDGFVDNFLSFPENGKADQSSAELQFIGEYDNWNFVTGLYYFEETGDNRQNPVTFNGDGTGNFLLKQDIDSTAIYANIGYQLRDGLRISGGLRYTEDEKTANININNFIIEKAKRDWDELSWELALSWDFSDVLTAYATVQNGYQSGQFPPRPYCLFGSVDFSTGILSRPNCFEANDNITAINYETGIKGTPLENLKISVSVFYTNYSDLPYQVNSTSAVGFDTRNIIVDQDSYGLEWENSWAITHRFQLHTSLGYIRADVDDRFAVAPLTPELTVSISPEYNLPLASGAEITLRADWSYRDDMYGEPTKDPGRYTAIDSRDLLNLNISYYSAQGDWMLGLYGRNVTDERYEQARLNTGDYVLVILSNDASEFGIRFNKEF